MELKKRKKMNLNFTDFLVTFSRALSLISHENGNHGLSRCIITMAILKEQGASLNRMQQAFILSMIYEIEKYKIADIYKVQNIINDVLYRARKANAFLRGMPLDKILKLVILADDYCYLSKKELHDENVKLNALKIICNKIGTSYSLVDVITLREVKLKLNLSWDGLHNVIHNVSPFSCKYLAINDLREFCGIIADVSDRYCHKPASFSKNVAKICAGLAQLYGFPDDGQETMRLAGLLHGIGKFSLPSKLLKNERVLRGGLQKKLRFYPMLTRNVLIYNSEMYYVARIASHLHERLDGRGFSEGLRGTSISLSARIISVAYFYMHFHTKYYNKSTFSPGMIIAMLKKKAYEGAIDIDVVNALADNIELFHID